MALQLNVAVSESEVYPEAYIHIVYVRSEAKETYIFANWFRNREERIASCTPVPREQMHLRPKAFKSIEHVIATKDYAPGVIWPNAYEYLKSLPEYAGAIDIIDPVTEEPAPVEEVILQEDLQPTQAPAEA